MKAKRIPNLRRVQRPERKNDDVASSAKAAAKVLDANPVPIVGRYVLDPKTGKLYGPSK